jgi:cell division protein FtsI (penicillin-binding protein 3)
MSLDLGLASQNVSSALAERQRRLGLVAVCFALGFLSVALRLLSMVDWHQGGDLGGGVLAASANAAASPDQGDEPAVRAEITDRNGVLLATNLNVPSVEVNPSAILDKDEAARRFASVLRGVDAKQLAERLHARGHLQFAWIKRQITPEEQKAVLELGIPSTKFSYAPKRVYPKQNLASHVVGVVNVDNGGQFGLEKGMNDRLGKGAAKGPLALSLDMRVQQIVREELFSAFVRFKAAGAGGIVLDVETGEVLAMVSLPDFDPNRPETATQDQLSFSRVTGGTYELGSVFKAFSSAMALDSGAVSMYEEVDAIKPLYIGGFVINDDHALKRYLTVPECFVHSSNICTAKMVFKSGGGAAMESFLRKIGLYDKPNIELPQNELGKPRTPGNWKDLTTATVSFGHSIAISPFQYVDALSGLVRGDGWARPTLLRRDGPVPLEPSPISARTMADLRWLMWLTVEKGTATKAKQAAYLIGGKTGTADKAGEKKKGEAKGYRKGSVIASFVGVFPIEKPRYVVLAMLDEPQGDKSTHGFRYGGWTAAPVVGAIVDRMGPLLGIMPSEPTAQHALFDRLIVTKGAREGDERLAALGSRQ